MYYIAYGSNLNIYQMRFRCPSAIPVGTSVIKGYELKYKGSLTGSYLTIEKKLGGVVPVGIWEISDSDLKNLDAYEGYPRFYYRREMKLRVDMLGSDEREDLWGIVYIMHEDRKEGIPAESYIETCERGYADFGLDISYLDEALIRTYNIVAQDILAGDEEPEDIYKAAYQIAKETKKKVVGKKKKSDKKKKSHSYLRPYTERWLEVPHYGW